MNTMNNSLDFNLKAIIKYSFLFLTLIICFSCDPGSDISYIIINKTSKDIDVKCHFRPFIYNDTLIGVYHIKPDSSIVVFNSFPTGAVDNCYDVKADSIYINYLIIRQDNKAVQKNYKDKKNWEFTKVNRYKAWFLFVVDSSNLVNPR